MSLTYTPNLWDEHKMLQLLSAGSEVAFTQIFDQYKGKVYSVAWKFLKTNDLAEEIVQDVFLKIWLKREKMAEVNNFRSYLFILTRNLIFDRMKSKAYETTADTELYPARMTISDADYRLRSRQCLDLLLEAISLLPPRQKEVFQMAKINGLSHERIARKLHLSPLTVKKHMAEALKFVRRHLEGLSAAVVCLLDMMSRS